MAINKDKVRLAAQKYLQQGKIDKAIKEYERLVEDDPKDVRTLLKLGDLQTRGGENAAATKTYTKVAQFYSEQGFFLKAVAVYKQILKIDPVLVDVNLKLAELYHQLGLLSDATNQYRQLSQLLEQAGRIDESISVLKKMVELDPDNVASRIKLAEIYAKQNLVDEARAEFSRAAAFLKKQHRVDDYVKVAERIVFFDQNDMATTRELANIYIQKGDARRALAKLQVCFKQNPKDVETLQLLANAFKDLGQIPKTVSVYKELARIHQEAGNQAQVQAVMQKVLDLTPDDPEARSMMQASGAPEPQKSALARIVPAQKQVQMPADVREVVRPNEDEGSFEVDTDDEPDPPPPPPRAPALAAAPVADGDDPIHRLLVETEIYIKYGLRAKAIEHIKKIFALDPEHREASQKHKDLLVESGELPAATEQLLTMARVAQAQGNKAQAQDDLEELLGLDPRHPEGRALLMQIAPEAVPAEPAPEGGDEELSSESGGGEDVPAVVLEGASGGVALSYEPSPEAAGIDLDDDDDDEQELGLDGGEDEPLEVEKPSAAPAKPVPAAMTPAPVTAAAAPATVAAPPPATLAPKPVAAPPPAAKPAAPKAPPPKPQPVDPALDDLLASAVPSRSAKAPAPAKPAAPSSPPAPKSVAPAAAAPTPKPAPAPAPAAAEGPPDISDELEELEFFIQQGLEDEAKDALQALLGKYPGHEKLLAIQVQLHPPEPAAEPPAESQASEPEPEPTATPDDQEPEPETTNLAGIAADLDKVADDYQVSFSDVFDEFKKGVEKQVEESDYETHYNLGIAYREMGLVDDAVREFGLAQRSPEREIVALTMIGLCELERGNGQAALQSFQLGLNSQYVSPLEAVALRYEIGAAYEAMGRHSEAAKFFEKVASMDAQFRDVTQRLESARGQAGDQPAGASDELDQLLEETAAEREAQSKGGKISYL